VGREAVLSNLKCKNTKNLLLALMGATLLVTTSSSVEAQYYQASTQSPMSRVEQLTQRHIYGGETLNLTQILRLNQQVQPQDKIIALSIMAASTSYHRAMASLIVNGRVVGFAQTINAQMKQVQFPVAQLQLQQVRSIRVQISGNVKVIKVSADIYRSDQIGGNASGLQHLKAKVNKQVYGQEQIIINHQMRRSAQQLEGLKLLRVNMKARVMGYSQATAQLMINGQQVGYPQQISNMTTRFDTGIFKGAVIAQQVKTMTILVRGNVFVESIGVRGRFSAYANGHGNRNGHGNTQGHGNAQGSGRGNNVNGGQYGDGNGDGNGNGNGNGNGDGTGNNNSAGNGDGQGTIGNANSESIELGIMQSVVDKESFELKDYIDRVHRDLKLADITKIEITASPTTDKQARVIVRAGSNLLGSVRISNEETKTITIDSADQIKMKDVKVGVTQGASISVVKVFF
jgi:hypothetical protein